MKSAVVLLLLIALSPRRSAGEESSDAYLRNVVEELQILNGVAPSERSTRVVTHQTHDVDDDGATASETVSMEAASSDDRLPSITFASHDLPPPPPPKRQQLPRKPAAYFAEPPPLHHHQQQGPPTVLGFSAAELASMYRKALERGVSHNGPAEYNIDGSHKVTPALRVQQPGYGSNYAYYFYPLDSFRHELVKQTAPPPVFHHAVPEGYHTLPDTAYASTTIIDPNRNNNKKDGGIMHHIVTGVSSFIGMAMFFLLSMFVYPRFLHMMHFPFVTTSRTGIRNELGHLAAYVTDAIDAYNRDTRRKSKHLPQR